MGMSRIWWRLKNALFRISRPGWWMQNERTDYGYDDMVRKMLDRHPLKYVGGHTAKLGTLTLWVANYPYAFGTPQWPRVVANVLPAPLTRRELKRRLLADFAAKEDE
jgi:hypothetical protein